MPITIEVVAPSSAAKTEIVALGKEIDKTTAAAKGLGDALEKGARQGSTTTQRAKTDYSQLGAVFKTTSAAFSPIADEFARQKQILDSIQQPMHQHLQDLRSLQQLYKAGALSAGEFAAKENEITAALDEARNKRLGLKSAPAMEGTKFSDVFKDAAGQAGLGDVFGAMTGSAGAATAALTGAAVAAVALRDAYANLHNSALGLVGSTGSVNAVIGQQIKLAGELHGKTEEAIAVTMRAQAGNDQYNLTQKQLLDLTKETGQIVQLSGHQLGDAAGFMDRLTASFDAGRLSGDELRGMFREFPAFATSLSRSFGLSTKSLQEMADEGKLAPAQILAAMQKDGANIEKDFTKHIDLVSSKWSRFKDSVLSGDDTNVKQLMSTDAFKAGRDVAARLNGQDPDAANQLAKQAAAVAAYNEKVDIAVNAETRFYGVLGKVSQELRDQSGFYKGVTDAINARSDAIKGAKFGQDTSVAVIVEDVKRMNQALTGATADQIKNLRGTFGNDMTRDVRALQDATLGVTKETVSYGAAVADAKTNTNQHQRGIEDITAAYKAGAVTAKEYSDQMRNLSEDFAFAYGVIHNITQPSHEWQLSLTTLASAVQSGTISLHEFNDALGKLHDQPVDTDKLRALRESFGLKERYQDRLPSYVGVNKKFGLVGSTEAAPLPNREAPNAVFDGDNVEGLLPGGAVADSNHFKDNIFTASDAYWQIVGDLRTNAEKYAAEQQIIDRAPVNALTDADKAKALQNLSDKYISIRTPMEQYEMALRQVREEQAIGRGSIEAYDEAFRNLRVQFGQGTVTDGLIKGFEQLRKEGTDVASQISTELTDAFKTVNDALTDLIVSGTTDWHKMVDALQREIVGNLLKTLEGGVINMIMPQTQAATAGVTTGTSAATTMLAAAPGIGAAIGASAAAAMAGGQAAGAAAGSFFSDAIASAQGSDWFSSLGAGAGMAFATGGSFKVGGDGGSDTTPVHFMATRGERVTVETPSQQRQGDGGSAPAQVRVINVSNQREQTLASMNTRQGEQLILNGVRKNARTIVGHILR